MTLNGITDLAGNALSGTGSVAVRALYGDVNQDGVLTIGDAVSLRNNLGVALSGSNFLNDVNLSGTITIGDAVAVRDNLGHVLAATPTQPVDGTNVVRSSGVIAFSAAGYSAMATATNVLITVTRTGSNAAPASVTYATSDGMAVAGVNYLSAAGTLSFGAGETNKSINIVVLNGPLWTGDGSINLSLVSPTGGATLGMQTNAVLTIAEEDLTAPGLLRFSASACTAATSGSGAVITITRTGGCAGAVSVSLATTGGTAVPWTDYNPVADTISFADGETVKTYVVPLLGNGAAVGKTIELDLLNPAGGASLVAPGRIMITLD